MGSYLVDKLAAGQGRYADVVNVPQTAEKKTVQPLETPEPAAKPTLGELISLDQARQEKQSPLEEQKARYEEIAKDEGQMSTITEALNKFMAQFSADAQFFLHKDTSIISVKFVDLKNNKVLKEFPPEEYLDMIANIRKYIGAIVDEKA